MTGTLSQTMGSCRIEAAAVLWRKKEDDAKMNGVCLKGEVVVMDKEYKEKLEMEECSGAEESMHDT